MRVCSLLGGARSGSMSGGTFCAGGLTAPSPLFILLGLSETSAMAVGGGDSQWTEENSESAIINSRKVALHALPTRKLEQGWGWVWRRCGVWWWCTSQSEWECLEWREIIMHCDLEDQIDARWYHINHTIDVFRFFSYFKLDMKVSDVLKVLFFGLLMVLDTTSTFQRTTSITDNRCDDISPSLQYMH